MTNTNRRLVAVATGQHGIVTREAANAAGVSDAGLRRRVQSGFLQQIGPHTFRVSGTATTPTDRLRGVFTDIGPPCWVSGPTAAALHGFDGWALRVPWHVMVPRCRNVRRTQVVVHTTDELPPIDLEEVSGLPITSPTRTIIDLAKVLSAERLAAAVDAAIRDGLTSEDLLHRRIVALRTRGRYGLPVLADVLVGRDVVRGGHSWLEREFLTLLHNAQLPMPITQQHLSRAGDRIVRVDCRFRGTPVVVELLGYRFHRSRAQLQRDSERLNALLLDQFVPFQFTYDMVVDDPTGTLATVAQALALTRSA